MKKSEMTFRLKTKAYLSCLFANPARYLIEKALFFLFSRWDGIMGMSMRAVIFRPLFKGEGLFMIEKNVDFRRTDCITLEKGVFIGKNCSIYGMPDGIHLGKNVKIKENCYIDAYNFSRYVGNSRFVDGARTKIAVGENSVIGPYSIIYGTGGVEIGKNAIMAARLNIVTQNHIFSDKSKLIIDQGIECRKVKIGDNVWIGINTTILPGVKIGNGAVIGANTIVTKDVPPNSIVVGNPGRVIKNID